MIKVVHITENPIAGAPINLSKALNKYQGDKVSSVHIAQSDRNENRIFDSDIIIDQVSEHFLRHTLEQADIIHLHNFYQNQHLFRKHPMLWDIVMRKKRVWQCHSQRSTSWVKLTDALEDKKMKHLVIGQYHPREWPECEVVPNVIDIWAPELMPDWTVKNDIPRVVFSPSRINCPGWDDKSYAEVKPVLQQLVDENKITAEIIYDKPFAECLARRRKADIGIDEIKTGSFHLTSLECLSSGLVTVAGLDEIQVKTLKDLTGSNNLPWLVARPENLKEKIESVCQDVIRLRKLRENSRLWMEQFWEPKLLTRKFVTIYEGL